MFKVMGTYDVGITKLYVGEQDFVKGTVQVKTGNKINEHIIYIDENGDIYFEYQGRQIYFRHLK